MKKKKLLPLLLVFTLISCNNDIKGEWKTHVVTVASTQTTANTYVTPFNTSMQINYFLNEKNKEEVNINAFNNVKKIYESEVNRLHVLFDRHYYYKDNDGEVFTNVKTINESYGSGTPIKCSDELYELLKQGVECFKLTDGMFNIFTGSLTNYWDQVFASVYSYEPLDSCDPNFNELKRLELEELVNSIPKTLEQIEEQLTFDDENKTVTFNKCDFNNDIKPIISVGGIAKGYATDIIKETLKNNGYIDGYLISGGSSISSLSKPIYTKEVGGQKISVINPAKSTFFEKQRAFSLLITEEFSFSTSGNYTDNKSYVFIDEDGNRIYRHHIINPFTGYPESYYRSISILTTCFSNLMVDALSTAFMNLNLEDGMKLRNKILELYPDSNLELMYLLQENDDKNAICTVHATSDINGTFQAAEGIEIIYEN